MADGDASSTGSTKKIVTAIVISAAATLIVALVTNLFGKLQVYPLETAFQIMVLLFVPINAAIAAILSLIWLLDNEPKSTGDKVVLGGVLALSVLALLFLIDPFLGTLNVLWETRV